MPESVSTDNHEVAMTLAAVELTKHVTFTGDTGSAEKLAKTYRTLYEAVHAAYRERPTG